MPPSDTDTPTPLSLMLDFVRNPDVCADLMNIIAKEKFFPLDAFHPVTWDLPPVSPMNAVLSNAPIPLDYHLAELTTDKYLVNIFVGAEELLDNRDTLPMMRTISDRTYETMMAQIVWKTRPDVNLFSYMDVYMAAVASEQMIPVSSFILYYREKPWNGPKSLLEAVGDIPYLHKLYKQMQKDITPYIFDLSLLKEEELALTESDLWAVSAAAKYRRDPLGLEKYVQTHGQNRKPLKLETLILIREVFGISECPAA